VTLFHPWPPAPLHMGSLHPYEQGLTLLLAFGPFVLLAVVVWWRRRGEHDSEHDIEHDSEHRPLR
jgi:hypothetical protein